MLELPYEGSIPSIAACTLSSDVFETAAGYC